MSSTSPWRRLQREATCPGCQDYFAEPMILDCGHNLCFKCIANIWSNPQVEVRCPRCMVTVQPENFKPNLQLASMVQIAKVLSKEAKPEAGGGKCCEKHQEPLKLFCKEDKNPICLVCDRSKQHREHQVVPIEEAGQEYKIWEGLETLRKEREKILAYKTLAEKECQDLLKQIKAERAKTIVEFRSLRLFLEEQEKLILVQIEEIEEDIARKRDDSMAKFSEELSSLETLIQEMEDRQQLQAGELLQDIGNALERSQKWKLENAIAFPPELKWSAWDLCDLIPYLKGVMEQFRDHLVYGFQLRKADIRFDPTTANPWLILSPDCKSVSKGDLYQCLPNNSARFDTCTFVLGHKRFTTGRHLWKVDVGSEGKWAIGVAKESVKRKGNIICIPSEGIWEMGVCGGEYRIVNPPANPILSLSEKPSKIFVTLNYEGQRVAFYDADTANLLCTFTEASFEGETVCPWFYVAKKACLTLSL